MKRMDKYPRLSDGFKSNNHERYNQAVIKANLAADILKTKYSANKVLLFGSLLDDNKFDENSDIDLAISGVRDDKFYEALGTIMQIVAPFDVDLIDINDCRESIRKSIEREGVLI